MGLSFGIEMRWSKTKCFDLCWIWKFGGGVKCKTGLLMLIVDCNVHRIWAFKIFDKRFSEMAKMLYIFEITFVFNLICCKKINFNLQ